MAALPVAIYTLIVQVVNRDVRRRRRVGFLWLGAAADAAGERPCTDGGREEP